MKNQIYFSLLILLFCNFVFSAKIVKLPQLINPNYITMDQNQLYISEGATIFIYSLKNFDLIKKFGKKGEGPGEFMVNLYTGAILLDVHSDNIIANTRRKVSVFSKKGEFKKDIRSKYIIGPFLMLGDKFVGLNLSRKNNQRYFTINLCDSSLNKIKEIHKQINLVYKGSPFGRPPSFFVCDNKIITEGLKNGEIYIFDNQGKELLSIEPKYEKIILNKNHKDKILNIFKIDPRTRQFFDMIKKSLIFPEYFPDIRQFFAADKKIYILTYKVKGDKSELLTFDINGKFLKTFFVKIREMNRLELYPFTIKHDKIYQLIENDDEEVWELFILDIK